MRGEVIITRWRDNANPFPGRITQVKTVWLSRSELAWREYVRRCQAARESLELKRREKDAFDFEELADKACEETP